MTLSEERKAYEREKMRVDVDHTLRILRDEMISLEGRHAALYMQFGEILFANRIGILGDEMKDEFNKALFDCWDKIKGYVPDDELAEVNA